MDSGSDIYFKWPNELKSLSLTPKISNTLSGDILLPQDTIWMHHHPQQALTWKAWVTPTQDTTSLCSFSSSYSFVCGTDIFELCMGLFHACALGSGRQSTYSIDSCVSSSTVYGVLPPHVPHTLLLEKMWLEDRGPSGDVRLSVESALHTQQHLRKQIPSQSTVAEYFFFLKPQKEL